MPNLSGKRKVPLTELKPGQKGLIIEITGGHGTNRRIESMGISAGKTIEKVSAQFMHGPITVRTGNTTIALGHGIAKKIVVEVAQ